MQQYPVIILMFLKICIFIVIVPVLWELLRLWHFITNRASRNLWRVSIRIGFL
jgi:hypothetical protein